MNRPVVNDDSKHGDNNGEVNGDTTMPMTR